MVTDAESSGLTPASGNPHRAPLDVDGVRRDLVGPDRPLRRLDVVESTGSTNADLLAHHAAGKDIGGMVLVAEHQSAGRGRHGRSWSTPPRSQIALSLGVDATELPTHAWGWLPLLTGVAVADAVEATTGIAPGLKWPNDIQVGEGKLGGILAEMASPNPVIVVGLGLNVSMTADEAPDERATSLLMLGSTMLDRSALLGSILAEWTARIDRWKITAGEDSSLVADYRHRSVTLGRNVRALLPGDREITGTATDIDELGQLVIDTGSQNVAVSAGDITHLRPAE
ncbi:MAG: biotin--[acetyl-CoA-carboxylase] ligase [Mycobacterium sp.]|nr:biotin--[acetyl-CoA-carboxylase] ligase [Mycobacterium sp.]